MFVNLAPVTVSDAGRFLCSCAKVAIVVATVAAVNGDVIVLWQAWQGSNSISKMAHELRGFG